MVVCVCDQACIDLRTVRSCDSVLMPALPACMVIVPNFATNPTESLLTIQPSKPDTPQSDAKAKVNDCLCVCIIITREAEVETVIKRKRWLAISAGMPEKPYCLIPSRHHSSEGWKSVLLLQEK